MPSVVLKKITQPQQISGIALYDRPTPLSYIEWIKNNIGIIPEDAQVQYEQYLTAFYRQKQTVTTDQLGKLKDDYLNLVKRLSIIFKNDPEFSRFANINFDSPTELQLAIPYFAKKLREIALYYVNVRDNLKKTKLQYATIGSETGLERFVYNKLLDSFATNMPLGQTMDIGDSGDFIDIKDNLKIEIEELYEDANYFPEGELDINPLFCVLDDLISSVCQNQDIFALSVATDPLRRQYLCEDDKLTPTQLVAEGWQEYMGNDLFYLTGGDALPNIFDVDLNFKVGNNFFYWFSGEAVHEIPEGVYNTIELSSLNWDDATASNTIDNADIIFTSYGNLQTEGAWFMSADKFSFASEMTATMFDGKEFKFPYPGFGLSAENGEWSGRMISDLTNDDKRFFPNDLTFQENKKEIKKLYWSAADTATSTDDIFIQNLNLWESGAFASTSFKQADKLIIRTNTGADGLHDTQPNAVYWGNLDLAWLYEFNKTQIPIISETNSIYFPLTSFQNSEDLYFKYESGADIPLSSIKVNGSFTGAIAGDDIINSDLIIKKRTICGPDLEAAWLAGTPLSALRDDDPSFCLCDGGDKFIVSTDWAFTKGVTQPGISFNVEPNNSTKFVWSGPNISISEIAGFNGFAHDATCPYLQADHTTSIIDIDFLVTDTSKIEKWRTCSCRSVYHSPLGLKASQQGIRADTDIILLDTVPDGNFNISEWRGRDGKTYELSEDASRFVLNDNSPELDVGWGQGSWDSGFTLETGKTYIYYRSNLNRCDIEVPEFIINECYAEIKTKCGGLSNIPIWKKAVQNTDGEWVKTDSISDMVMESGTFYDYLHRTNASWEKRKIQVDGADVTGVDFITINPATDTYTFKQAVNILPSIEFLIKIDLQNARPYWGLGSYENSKDTKFKNLTRNYDDNRLVGTSLIVNQPIPSRILLSDSTVIRYESFACNDCFIWKQPITINVDMPIRQWNKLIFDECVKSDILTYLHSNCNGQCGDTISICGCDTICSAVKTGVTATNIPSDMNFNVEMSGVPLFINYFARNQFDITFQVEDVLNPIISDVLSGTLVLASSPWRNLINDSAASFISVPDSSNLFTSDQLGILTPNNIGIGKYEIHSADRVRVKNAEIIFREDNYFDGSYRPTNINSEWMKKVNGEPLIDDKQTFYPYQSLNSDLGLYSSKYKINPWDTDVNLFPKNYRDQPYIECGDNNIYTSLIEITGNVINWQTDIYGNQFFLVNDQYTKYDNLGTGNLYLKVANNILTISALSSIFGKYNSIIYDTY